MDRLVASAVRDTSDLGRDRMKRIVESAVRDRDEQGIANYLFLHPNLSEGKNILFE